MTEMPYRMYTQGLKASINELAQIGKPIYITKNGVCDSKDIIRSEWIESHLNIISSAIAAGVDIRGFYYWTLIDNFEWAMGTEPKFGLYSFDFKNPTNAPALREGSKRLQEIIALNS